MPMPMPLYIHPSSSYVLAAPDVNSQFQSQSQPQGQGQGQAAGMINGMPMPMPMAVAYNQPTNPGHNNAMVPPNAINNMDASSSLGNMGTTHQQQQMVGAASPVRQVTNSAFGRQTDSLMGNWKTAGLAFVIAPLLLVLPAW
jgi:hypothetical protein